MKYSDFLDEIGHQKYSLVSKDNYLIDKKRKLEQQISSLGAYDIKSLKANVEEKKRILDEKKNILKSLEANMGTSGHIITDNTPWIIEQCNIESFWKRHTVPLIIAVIIVVIFFVITSAVS